MENSFQEARLDAALERLLAEPAPERAASPFAAPGHDAERDAADALDAQILAALVSP